MGKTILQIVPTLPPAISGVGDYALILARAMRQHHGINSIFIVGNPEWHGGSEIEGFEVRTVASRTDTSLIGSLDSSTSMPVLLHYVGYGYARRGAPFWLSEGLKQWHKKARDPLVTMFHEVYASGPMWKSEFWYRPAQIVVAQDLLRISEICVTSNEFYGEVIRNLDPFYRSTRDWLKILPVFSNVGEPDCLPSFEERKPQAVVFGGLGRRQEVYNHWSEFLPFCEKLGIQSIVDIGPGKPACGEILNVNNYGILDPMNISSLLKDSKMGLLLIPLYLLNKSTIFASFLAHGLVSIISSKKKVILEYKDQENYFICADTLATRKSELINASLISERAFKLYQTHSSKSLSLEYSFFLS
ncbi:MAG: glycosyltransferase family 1 protein [Cyanobacteriota bacterium]|nr:glycosyltransferase family 1 protein [Cyanobacteriota bacterium]